MQREERLDEHVNEQIASTMMRQFMRDREIPRPAIARSHEARRQGDHPVDHAESQRSFDRTGFDKPHPARLADRARCGEQFPAHTMIKRETAYQKYGCADQPEAEQDCGEIDVGGGLVNRHWGQGRSLHRCGARIRKAPWRIVH